MRAVTSLPRNRQILLGVITMCVAVAPALADPDIFFSEYVEGTQAGGIFNVALEIFNPTDAVFEPTDEQPLIIDLYLDGSATESSSSFHGDLSSLRIEPGDAYVITAFTAEASLLAHADGTSLVLAQVDGNDAIVLRHGDAVVDVIGQIGVDPGAGGWGAGDTATTDRTLRRKPAICGDADGTDPFDPATEWEGFPIDTFDGLGAHDTECDDTPIEASTWSSVKALYR